MATAPKSKPSFTSHRKWGVGFDVVVRTLVVVAVLVMLNHLASVFFHRQYLSEATKAELSPRTRNFLQALTNEVKVTIYYNRDDDFYPPIAAMLRDYQAVNPKLRVETVDYLRDAAAAGLIKREFDLPETAKDEEKNFVLFKCGSEKRVVPGHFLTDTVVEVDQARKTYNRRAVAFKGETVFTAMLLSVTSPKLYQAYVLQGHGAHDIESGDEISGYLDFKSLLQQNTVKVAPLILVGTNEVPADCNLLIIPGPRSAIPARALEKIEQYLDEGGRLFALFNAATMDRTAGLENILSNKWNVLVTDSVVTDPDNAISQFKTDVRVAAFSEHPAVKGLLNFELDLLSPRVVGELKRRENATDVPAVTTLFATERSAKLVNNPGIPAQSFPLAVAVEKRPVPGVVAGRGTTRMIVVGDSFFLANGQMKLVANRDFAGYALNWLLDRPQFTEGIGPKPVNEYRMTLPAAQLRTLRWLLLGAVPGGILLFGGLVWWRRQK
jgi:ABC-2 type transport system permease protein